MGSGITSASHFFFQVGSFNYHFYAMKKTTIILSALMATVASTNAQQIHFPLDGNTTESITSTSCTMNGVRTLPYAQGVKGQCARFDGYSNYISGTPSYTSVTPGQMTFSLWLAPETYPMMNTGEAQVHPTYTMVAGNYDYAARTGIGLYLSSQGDYQVNLGMGSSTASYYVKGDRIDLGKWNNVVVTVDSDAKKVFIYRNGIKQTQDTESLSYTVSMGTSSFIIGKDRDELKSGAFHINTFNGLIDEVRIDNGVKTADQVKADYEAVAVPAIEELPVTSLFSDTEYAHLRPQFHGMPAHGWTNESHGMVYHNGKYHVFFQKNGNGPYMARLHWGHITSTDLLNWSEQPVAIAPGASNGYLEANDGKGCWSGCVFTDPDINGGKPTIFYTGVSNAKAFIWQAVAKDDDLMEWEKQGVKIYSGGNPCNADASDDFRDPYFFTANGQKYIIIGTSDKSHVGTCLLYKYNGMLWTYQGLFFSGTSQAACGRFWEMPNVTPLGDGKYLFTVTPLDAEGGVKTLYWIGTIGADGKFTPDQAEPQYLEMGGISKDGYGLLSPTIYNHDGRLLLLGIVPDKVATEHNYQWGWAHNYSLPREFALSADGKSIVQKPCTEFTAIRSDAAYLQSLTLNGTQSLAPVAGRQVELEGSFTVGTTPFGFNFLKSGSQAAELSYDPATNTVKLDITSLQRIVNDNVYGGIYTATLPEKPAEGSKLNIHVYVDGSIADIFIADKWAFSVRIFPTDVTCTEAEAFGNTEADLKAWVLDAGHTTGIEGITVGDAYRAGSACYNLLGQRIARSSKGIVICGGRKYLND